MGFDKQTGITSSGRDPINAQPGNEQVDVEKIDGDDQPDPYTQGLRFSFQQPGGDK
jgi:hypothetical protein